MKNQQFSRWAERITGLGLGIVAGSGLTYYFVEIQESVNADTFVILIGLGVVIIGSSIRAVVAYKDAKNQ